jgi:hypothetical protein
MTNEILKFEESEKVVSPKPQKKLKKVKRPKSTSSEGHYITNASLFPAMLRAQEAGYVTPELAEMFLKVVQRYSLSKNYAHLGHIKDDMIAEAMLNLIKNGLKFNPEKSKNVFSYITTCAYHSFLNVIAEDKDNRDLRDKLLLSAGVNASLGYMEREHDNYWESHFEN